MNRHVMIDLETLGTGPGAVVQALGAVIFDPMIGRVQTAEEMAPRTFKRVLNIQEQLDAGFHIEASTLLWWLSQSRAAQEASFAGLKDRSLGENLQYALWKFGEFLEVSKADVIRTTRVWGNGANFDISILEASYKRMGMDVPWNFRGVRCYRTLLALLPLTPEELPVNELAHDALSDAIYQARVLQALHLKYPQVKF